MFTLLFKIVIYFFSNLCYNKSRKKNSAAGVQKNTPYLSAQGVWYWLFDGATVVITPRPQRIQERKPSGRPSWEPLPQTELPCPQQRADGEEQKPWEWIRQLRLRCRK